MEDLATLLAGGGDMRASGAMRHKFPTAALAILDFDCTGWDGIAPGAGRLERFITPRMLEQE